MFLSIEDLKEIGFKSVGENVFISSKASIYSPHLIEIGNNVRIDDFVILSPGSSLRIGNYVHIGCYVSIIGRGEVIIEDFAGLSGRVSLYSSSDDFTGLAMTGPMIPIDLRKVTDGKIHIKKHVVIGCGSLILPGVTVGMGCSIFAKSLIKSDCEEMGVYFGSPAKKINKRLTRFLDYEKKLIGNN